MPLISEQPTIVITKIRGQKGTKTVIENAPIIATNFKKKSVKRVNCKGRVVIKCSDGKYSRENYKGIMK